MDKVLYIEPIMPPESYSRQLDNLVEAMEMPYGYINQPPAADYENPASKEQMNTNKGKYQ